MNELIKGCREQIVKKLECMEWSSSEKHDLKTCSYKALYLALNCNKDEIWYEEIIHIIPDRGRQ